MVFPRLLMVRQQFEDRALGDVPGAVTRQLNASPFAARLRPGSRVAIGVGSRGIANIDKIVRAVIDYWKAAGMHPFLFPAMGSHGAATAEGQAEVLQHYGITESSMGCPLVSQLDVVSLGRTAEGIEAFMDRTAYEADGVMLVGRVKWHTDFAGNLESGLYKMMAIGVGKFAGAQMYHTFGYRLGLERVIRSVGRQVLGTGKVLGGLAILEDAYHNTAMVEAVPIESMERREEELLTLVKSWMAKLPLDLDILMVDKIGKNYSGTGMDSKVVNRSVDGKYNPWPGLPQIERILVRGLSEITYGNAVGLGMADMVTDRLVEHMDVYATNLNSLTATMLAGARIPIHFATDRACLEKLAPTVGKLDTAEVTYGWIHNSMELSRLALSENLRPKIEALPHLQIEGGPFDMPFGEDDNLVSVLAPAEATSV